MVLVYSRIFLCIIRWLFSLCLSMLHRVRLVDSFMIV
uniref:Serine-rich and transmembrane domain-containing protein 1 n=1 Tax=Podoviridae sp. ctG4L18 TaxID=2825234 RepID=A0A8S5UNY2_9CAUD|nr:MAG TPA: Serine-rich and transmembrane domain-containing protein 1 [Podoviridae sp. ctG4L18]DAJ73417.1 MAG TPA: Serine-rich and transmembrane domain-containing protein 1 [Caudoviricetes sp.]